MNNYYIRNIVFGFNKSIFDDITLCEYLQDKPNKKIYNTVVNFEIVDKTKIFNAVYAVVLFKIHISRTGKRTLGYSVVHNIYGVNDLMDIIIPYTNFNINIPNDNLTNIAITDCLLNECNKSRLLAFIDILVMVSIVAIGYLLINHF